MAPWETGVVKLVSFDDDNWELYDTTKDWSQAKDLAKEQPEKLREPQQLWMIEAVKYNVLPLDDRFAERANPDLAGRPQLVRGSRQLRWRDGAADGELDPSTWEGTQLTGESFGRCGAAKEEKRDAR